MYFFGINYCPPKHCCTIFGWAWWWNPVTSDTYFPDIEYRYFLRVLGVEFKLMWWKPKPNRATLPADPKAIYFDDKMRPWRITPVEGEWFPSKEGFNA